MMYDRSRLMALWFLVRTHWQSVLLALFVINLGMVSGAGLYEARIVVPEWLVKLPTGQSEWHASRAAGMNVGLRFWAFISTVPLTLLTVGNLVAAWAYRGNAGALVWQTSASLALLERALTFGLFIPTMIRLFDAKLTQNEAVPLAMRWVHMNSLRHALVLCALVLALYAFRRVSISSRLCTIRSA